jgi:hypothetical protein
MIPLSAIPVILFLFVILFLIVRMLSFNKLTIKELPRANKHDLQEMRDASKTALIVFAASALFNLLTPAFLPSLQLEHETVARFLPVINGIGFLSAWVLDLKAEGIKKHGRDGTQSAAAAGEIHGYHILVGVFLPFLALPWGIVDLFRKRFPSGLTLILISALMGFLLFKLISSPSGTVPRREQAAPRTWTEAEAKAEAVRRYPQLGVANSQMNRAFLARYQQMKANNPAFFSDSAWPLRLAEEVAR